MLCLEETGQNFIKSKAVPFMILDIFCRMVKMKMGKTLTMIKIISRH